MERRRLQAGLVGRRAEQKATSGGPGARRRTARAAGRVAWRQAEPKETVAGPGVRVVERCRAPGGSAGRRVGSRGATSRSRSATIGGPGRTSSEDTRIHAPQRDRRPLHAVSFQGIGWGGKSELRRAVRRVIPGQGDLKESGTENIPPPGVPVPDRRAVRVKRCGKSAPRPPQGGWQAKPRTEQDRIGRRSRAARPKPPGRLLDPASDGGARGMVVARRRPVRGRRRVQNSAYRPSAAL